MFVIILCEVIFLVGSNFVLPGLIQIFLNKNIYFFKKVVGSADPTPPSLPPPLHVDETDQVPMLKRKKRA